MPATRGLYFDYVPLEATPAGGWLDVLGVATFDAGTQAPLSVPADIPVAHVRMPVLSGSSLVYEVWRGGEPARSGRHGEVFFRRNRELLFGAIAVAEAQGAASSGTHLASGVRRTGPTPLHQATTEVYRQICATLDAEDTPHLLRVWNYLPEINRDSAGTERYRQFNTARQHALRASGRPLTGTVPAASALGASAPSPLVVYFLAGRTAPTFVENPRQVSAYHYPSQYGTHSPVFSRAALVRDPGKATLLISGTASIVGHRSLHVGDTAAQTRETLANIEALLTEANRLATGANFSLGALACKVYVRRPADLPVIQAQVDGVLGASARLIYLQAEICRENLLVEIEAAAMCPLPAAA